MIRSRFIVLLAAAAVLAAACAPAGHMPTWTYTPGGANGAGATPAASSDTASGEILGPLAVASIDLAFEPKELTVEKAGRYEMPIEMARYRGGRPR